MKTKLFFTLIIFCLIINEGKASGPKACNVPATPGAITGCITPCEFSTGNPYSIAAVAGATSYTWTVSAGGTITAGQGSTSIYVTFGGAATGYVIVTADNSCGNSSPDSLAISVTVAPSTPSAPSGNLTPAVSSTNTYTVSPIANATTYTWSVSNTNLAAITLGQGTTSITVTNTSTAGTYSLCVMAGNCCGNSQKSCISVTSSPTAIQSIGNESSSLNIYPNPSDGLIKLSYSLEGNLSIRTTVIDELGQAVYDKTEMKHAGNIEETINLRNLATGVYTLQILTSHGSIIHKFVIMNR